MRAKVVMRSLRQPKNLPHDRQLIIAGWDIKGERYTKHFKALAQKRDNVTFLGKLNSRAEISQFFNQIDLFLSPSVREGGNIALQEAIWHGVPFLTTDAPGCQVLADIFECPTVKMQDYGHSIKGDIKLLQRTDTGDWQHKIVPFLTGSVFLEYRAALLEIAHTCEKK